MWRFKWELLPNLITTTVAFKLYRRGQITNTSDRTLRKQTWAPHYVPSLGAVSRALLSWRRFHRRRRAPPRCTSRAHAACAASDSPCWRSSCHRCHRNNRASTWPPPRRVPALGSASSWETRAHWLKSRFDNITHDNRDWACLPVSNEGWLETESLTTFCALVRPLPCVHLQNKLFDFRFNFINFFPHPPVLL